VKAAPNATALGSGSPLPIEYRIIRPDRSVRVLREIGEVIRDPSGRPIQFVGTTQDITELRASEAERTRLVSRSAKRMRSRIGRTGIGLGLALVVDVGCGPRTTCLTPVTVAGLPPSRSEDAEGAVTKTEDPRPRVDVAVTGKRVECPDGPGGIDRIHLLAGHPTAGVEVVDRRIADEAARHGRTWDVGVGCRHVVDFAIEGPLLLMF